MLNKQKGNMYGFVTHTWNPIKGECSHDCKYCYMKVWKQKPIRLDEKDLNDDLGNGNFIFIGSSTDMFANDVPHEWIIKVLKYCKGYDNKYLFQTKNPKKMREFLQYFPPNTTLGVTIESNIDHHEISKAPLLLDRRDFIKGILLEKMVSIEPIMDFDLDIFVKWIEEISPVFVSIGADSKGHNLPEPSKEKVETLIKELSKFTKVIQKDNLKRLLSL